MDNEQKKAMRKDAKAFYKENLQGRNIPKEGFDRGISFTNKGIDEVVSTSADPTKLDFLPKLEEIIEKGTAGKPNPLYKNRKDGFTSFKYIKTPAKINGKKNNIFVNIGKQKTGKDMYSDTFYNVDYKRTFLNRIYDYLINNNPSAEAPGHNTKALRKGNNNITQSSANVNRKSAKEMLKEKFKDVTIDDYINMKNKR